MLVEQDAMHEQGNWLSLLKSPQGRETLVIFAG
jgi:hypothetical protein